MRDATGLILQMRKLRPTEGSHRQVAALRALEGHAGPGLASIVRACNWVGSLGFGQERVGIMLLVAGEGLQGSGKLLRKRYSSSISWKTLLRRLSPPWGHDRGSLS